MFPVIRTEQAESDLEEILDYLDRHSPPAAEKLAAAIQKRCDLLGQFPKMGRARDELVPGLRSITVKRYSIFYRVSATAVEIVRILHGARDIERIMKPEKPDDS